MSRENNSFFNFQIILILILIVLILFINNRSISFKPEGSIYTNQQFISELYFQINTSNELEVLDFVFNQLNDVVIIFPTENYYYFKFIANGKIYGGAFSLFADNRDEGYLGFGYIERSENAYEKYSFEKEGGGGVYNQKDGVYIEKINDWAYDVRYKDKTVRFNLNDVGVDPPKKMLEVESYVGPIFDESGLIFDYLYNREEKKIYYSLKMDGYVPETFETKSENVYLGKRTGFLFYFDDLGRYILIGAKGENVLQNNWYDGPFDQIPDNYILNGQIRGYEEILTEAYPNSAGKIDKFGNYIYETGTRIAVAPYYVYWGEDYLDFIYYCEENEKELSKKLSCLTQQIYIVPEDKYY